VEVIRGSRRIVPVLVIAVAACAPAGATRIAAPSQPVARDTAARDDANLTGEWVDTSREWARVTIDGTTGSYTDT
jgi:hypothetical protein